MITIGAQSAGYGVTMHNLKTPRRPYTVEDLNFQLYTARAGRRASGMPDLRLACTCDDDNYLRRMIEESDPFQKGNH